MVIPPSPLASFKNDEYLYEDLTDRLRPARPPSDGKKRRYSMGFGPQAGKAGTTAMIQIQPRCLFRGDKIILTGDPQARLKNLFVGNTIHPVPPFNREYTGAFRTCDPALFMTMEVEYTQDCTFAATLVGYIVQ